MICNGARTWWTQTSKTVLDSVYDAVRNGQSLHELQRDGWNMGAIHEALGIWYDLGALARSQEKGFIPAPGFEEVDWRLRTF